MEKQMSPQEALNALDAAASTVHVNRQTHMQLQQAVRVLNGVVNPPKEEEGKPAKEAATEKPRPQDAVKK